MSQRFRRYCIPVVLLLSIFAISVTCDSSSNDLAEGEVVKGEVGKKLDTYLTRITPFGFSGALLVAKEGEIVLNKGYGLAIRSENVPNTSDTVFSTGSITKQFTAAGIMKLEMMGKLNTGDLLSEYFDNVPEDKKDIALHHLLTHTSGVVGGVGDDYEKALRDETVQKVLSEPLQFEPGKQFSYSNAGYSILAAIIEKVSEQSYEEFLNNKLFKPAGMEFTGYRMPEWTKKVVAHWYVGEKDNGTPLEKPYPYWNFIGNGGILSTTMDMYKWHLALLGGKILSSEAKTKMFTPFLNDYGYGWDVLEREMGILIQHDGGSSLGCSAEMRRYIDAGVVTILFCNQSYGREALFEPIRDKIEKLAFGGDVTFPPAVTTLNSEILRIYEGQYVLSGGGKFQVQNKGGVLLVNPDGQDAVNAMFNVKKVDAGTYDQLKSLSEKVFISALSGNFDEFGKALYDRDRMLGFLRDHIPMRLARHRERTGEIKEVFARVALPSETRGEKSAQIFVELKGEKGIIYFGLIWRNSKIVGIDAVMGIPDLSILFLPLTSTDFAGYHLDMARNFRISFLLNDGGNVTGLKLENEDGPVKAHKSK
ncbi:MAG TPA: serine hydrolase domain-containing protein [Candidatus Heimdallarchaeota archaeon]|nr:serine hydrolase domain-containing protein [Candidatus Heimdallarchaeota archaeon]